MDVHRKGRGAARAVPLLLTLLMISTLGSAPAAAQQGKYNGHCRRLTGQIARYQGDIESARLGGNAAWEASTRAHVDRLRSRRSRLCPEYDEAVLAAAARRSAEEMRLLMKLAAKAALTYFTGGAL